MSDSRSLLSTGTELGRFDHLLLIPHSPRSSSRNLERRLHEAEAELRELETKLLAVMPETAQALAPFNKGGVVTSNDGAHKGKTFTATGFSLYFYEPTRGPWLSVTGPLTSRPGSHPSQWAHWVHEFHGLMPWAQSDDQDAMPEDISIPPQSRAAVREYAQLVAEVQRASDKCREHHGRLLETPEVQMLASAAKPGEVGDTLSLQGWRRLFGQKLRLTRVSLMSKMTVERRWKPADLMWAAEGEIVSRSGAGLGLWLRRDFFVEQVYAGRDKGSWTTMAPPSRKATGFLFV